MHKTALAANTALLLAAGFVYLGTALSAIVAACVFVTGAAAQSELMLRTASVDAIVGVQDVCTGDRKNDAANPASDAPIGALNATW